MDKRESITIRLPPDLTIWLEGFVRGKGRIIEQALREYRERNAELTGRGPQELTNESRL